MKNTSKTLLIISISFVAIGVLVLLGSFNKPISSHAEDALVLTGAVAPMPSSINF